MKLLIVESPGKKAKIQSILGDGWRVEASVGHVRDLPERELGVDLENEFKPLYVATDRGAGVLAKLEGMARNADEVYLATDPDREGEAIAWHLMDALHLKNPKRVTFHAITEKDVTGGVAAPRTIDMALVRAQEGRRVLDRFCGYMVSGLLSRAIGQNKLSAGRVQSPALRLVVEREREIRAFKSTTHFGVDLTFEAVEGITDGWKASWKPKKGWLDEDQEYFLDKTVAEKIAALRTLDVLDCKESQSRQAPPAPFTTSTLQQAASNALKFNPKRTMEVAQLLYQGGHITYMRTDSPNLSASAIDELRTFAEAQGWPLPDKPRTWASKEGAQEAHEAIRPTHWEVEEAGDSDDEKALYRLIRLRALACQLAEAVYAVRVAELSADVEGKTAHFEARGRTLVDPGFKVVMATDQAAHDDGDEAEPDNAIPALTPGQKATALEGKLQTKKTKPAARFTEASLVRELEKRGIGRPATYAVIMDNIVQRGYVALDKRNLVPAPIGEKIVDTLLGNFDFVDFEFTRSMEEDLDDVASGKKQYHDIVAAFYRHLAGQALAFRKATSIPCPECGADLRHLVSKEKNYDFFACSDRENCGATFPNVGGKPGPKRQGPELTNFACEKCGKQLKHLKGQLRDGSGEYDFFACSDQACGAKFDNVEGKPVARAAREKKLTEHKCKKCGLPLEEKPTKTGGVWFSCSGWPKCETRYWALDDGTPNYDNKPKNKKK